jgi:hypothetical protein
MNSEMNYYAQLARESEKAKDEIYSNFKAAKKPKYFISFTWKNQQDSISFGNGVIDEIPLDWLNTVNNDFPEKLIRLLWWKQLSDEEDKASGGIGLTAF